MRKLYIVVILTLLLGAQSCKKEHQFIKHCDSCSIVLGCGTGNSGATATPASPDPPTTGSMLNWSAPTDPNWRVDFKNGSPCQEESLDQTHTSCKVTGAKGTYNYDITHSHCPGHGKITID